MRPYGLLNKNHNTIYSYCSFLVAVFHGDTGTLDLDSLETAYTNASHDTNREQLLFTWGIFISMAR
jgi:hypothetical protein